jgi:competence protein ComEC
MNAVVLFVNVGQGDCTIAVDGATRSALLVDCPAGQHKEVTEALRTVGASVIELTIISHSHRDHSGGILKILTDFPNRELRFNFDSTVVADTKERIQLLSMYRSIAGLRDIGVRLKKIYSGDDGRINTVFWKALAPTHDQILDAQIARDPNLASAILMLVLGDLRVLIAGDAEGRTWRQVLDRGEDVRADVLRIPHHGGALPAGSQRASLPEILDAVAASHCILSLSTSNQFNHPDPATLGELQKRSADVRVMCTQVNHICLGSAALPFAEASSLPELARLGKRPRPDECPCAGTVVIEVDDAQWTITPDVQGHDRVINALASPKCRP